MQIDVHRINAEIAGPHPADNRVEVRAVAINESARRMHGIGDPFHVRFEQAAGIGIGDHHTGHIRPQPRFQRCQIDPAFGRRGYILDPIASKGGSRRVRAMRAFRHQYHFAGIASRLKR